MFYVNMHNKQSVIFSNGKQSISASVDKKTIDFHIGSTVLTIPPERLPNLYSAIEEIVGYPDPEYNFPIGGIQCLKISHEGSKKFSISVYNSKIFFNLLDVPEFFKFFLTVQRFIHPLIKNDTRFLIWDANHKFINQLQRFDMTTIIETMIQIERLQKLFYVFPYPGLVNLKDSTKFAQLFKINNKIRYNIGIFSIFDEGSHYLTFVVDTILKDVWLFDSLSTDAVYSSYGFGEMMKTVFPNYKIYGQCILSGQIKKFEPICEDIKDYTDQNIYCHTWSLWFLFQIIQGIKLNNTLNEIVSLINISCSTPRENLIRIKNFSYWLAKNILEVKLSPWFEYICNPDHIVDEGQAKEIYEKLDFLNVLPEVVV